MTPEPAESRWWPAEIGRLELDAAVGKMFARYVDPLTGDEFSAGREQGGARRGWWICGRDESVRSAGYRDFSPAGQDAAIRKLRALAHADVGTGEWPDVSIEPGEQSDFDAFERVSG